MTRWLRPVAPLLMAALLLSGPVALAQDFTTTQIRFQSLDGQALASPGVDTLVEVVAVIRHDANESTSQAPITVELRIIPPTGADFESTRSVVPNRTANGTTTVAFEWRPTSTGEHTVEITVGTQTSSRTVTVAETARQDKTLADRFVDFWFVAAGFAVSVVLFVVMVASRRGP